MWAPAKINLNLLVGPRRSDGFHPLDSLVAKVTLYDRIDLYPRLDGHLHLKCASADCGDPEENLALRAARLLREHCLDKMGTGTDFKSAVAENRSQSPFCPGADIELCKNIPPGKGLGGGSSNAATVLLGLSEMWRLNAEPGELSALAAELGSDVPLFLAPSAARMTGRGEILQPINIHPFVAGLFLSDYFCGTADVYRAYDEKLGQAPIPNDGIGASPNFPSQSGSTRQLDREVLASRPPSQWRHLLVNQLSEAAVAVCPKLGKLWKELRDALPIPMHMSGSGSALFILCDDEAELASMLPRLPENPQFKF